jgi:hypothetical protein
MDDALPAQPLSTALPARARIMRNLRVMVIIVILDLIVPAR